MFQQYVNKGLLLGLSTGLVVTIFDGLFMLTANTYAPSSYPILLIVFNTVFWAAFGGVSGFFLWLFMRNRENLLEKEQFLWVLFFLVPFALVYGLMGRLFIPLSRYVNASSPVYDHHLSFVWVLLILLFFIAATRRVAGEKVSPVSFIPEVIAIALLFQFCSNIVHIQTISTDFFNYLNSTILKMELVQYLNSVYIAGTVVIVGLYCILFYTTGFLRKGRLSLKTYSVVGLVFTVTLMCLAGFYGWNHIRYAKQGFFLRAADKHGKANKIPQVIVIVLDTVRADHLSLYSGTHGLTEHLDQFSKDALVFESCITTSSWTLPSHASLFTGLYPTEHGSRSQLDPQNKWFHNFPPPAPLSREYVTLAEIFKQNDYQTAAVISNYAALQKGFNLDQGFQMYDTTSSIGVIYSLMPFRPIVHLFCHLTNVLPKYILPYRTADEMTTLSLRHIDRLQSGPFFLFLNFNDAHDPYRPPRPFTTYYADTAFPQLYRFKKKALSFLNREDKASLDAFLMSQYDGEIAYLDDQLGTFFSRLKRMGLYDSSLIVITSDHGELFGEHGLYYHRTPLYQGVVNVPLIIKFPFSKRVGSEKLMISLADLFPTILSICDLPIPGNISGKAFGKGALPIISELYNYGIGEHRALFDGEYKYMRYQQQRAPELYDLRNDLMEKDNLVHLLPDVTREMEALLSKWEEAHTQKFKTSVESEGSLSREIWEGLKALGYIQ